MKRRQRLPGCGCDRGGLPCIWTPTKAPAPRPGATLHLRSSGSTAQPVNLAGSSRAGPDPRRGGRNGRKAANGRPRVGTPTRAGRAPAGAASLSTRGPRGAVAVHRAPPALLSCSDPDREADESLRRECPSGRLTRGTRVEAESDAPTPAPVRTAADEGQACIEGDHGARHVIGGARREANFPRHSLSNVPVRVRPSGCPLPGGACAFLRRDGPTLRSSERRSRRIRL